MLYSLRDKMSAAGADGATTTRSTTCDEYPPELIVLATPNVSSEVKDMLCPIYCTRIVDVDYVPMPRPKRPRPTSSTGSRDDRYDVDASGSGKSSEGSSHVSAWDANCGLSKLAIFTLEQYSTLLYIDADCLVVQDVSHLLDIGLGDNNGKGKKGLVAAAPDIFPPDK